ncbi:MAG: hypothetical protein HC832_06755 [Leptolyngbyaceae cyanobacterium RM1_405_57]|nr:hypothetical protein [Leptolyngbyaceae cyanobacterium RM1_405_57]
MGKNSDKSPCFAHLKVMSLEGRSPDLTLTPLHLLAVAVSDVAPACA